MDKYQVKSSFELLFRDLKRHGPTLTVKNEDRLKCRLKNISYSYIYSYFFKQKQILGKEEWEALKNLLKDDSIITTKPEKGNGVVIVNKLDNLTRMKQLISDETKFTKLTENPSKSREQSLICYLRQLKRDHLIDDYTFQKVLPNGSTHEVLYGLPKVHKTGCLCRPIVSSTNTYSYNLASYLVSVLQPISTSCFSVKDFFSFAEWAKQYTHNGEFICSFDVGSLFTNVTLYETIEICLDKLYALANPPRLPRLVLKNLLLFATKKSHFVFDGKYYDQIDGVAMGSLCNIVTVDHF